MPKQESVNLNVQPGTNTGNGWIPVNAKNGDPYSFKYTGGDNGLGGMESVTGQGPSTLVVTLNGNNNRYSVTACGFSGDEYGQLSGTFGSGGNMVTIVDANTQYLNGDYSITVRDANANTTIECDPMIKNDPPPRLVHKMSYS
jgi:hypothetical protein